MVESNFSNAATMSQNSENDILVNEEKIAIQDAITVASNNKKFCAFVNNSTMTSITKNMPITVDISGDGHDAQMSANVGSILSIDVLFQTGNLRYSPIIEIYGDGSGCLAHCNTIFSIETISLSMPIFSRNGYNISIIGDGEGAECEGIFNNGGSLSGIKITNMGKGYGQQNTKLEILDNSGVSLFPVYQITFCKGIIENIIIDDSGKNYTYANVTFKVNGNDYYGLESSVNISDGITDLIVENAGNGYTHISANVSGGFGNGAEIEVTLGDSGEIASAIITNSGTGYSTPSVSLNGNSYYNAWKGCYPNREEMFILIDQMQDVMSYFQNLGYNITRIEAPRNLFLWRIDW